MPGTPGPDQPSWVTRGTRGPTASFPDVWGPRVSSTSIALDLAGDPQAPPRPTGSHRPRNPFPRASKWPLSGWHLRATAAYSSSSVSWRYSHFLFSLPVLTPPPPPSLSRCCPAENTEEIRLPPRPPASAPICEPEMWDAGSQLRARLVWARAPAPPPHPPFCATSHFKHCPLGPAHGFTNTLLVFCT